MVICVPATCHTGSPRTEKPVRQSGGEALGCGPSFRSGDRTVGVGDALLLRQFSDRNQRLALGCELHLERERPGDGAVFFLPNTYCYYYYVHRAEESQHKAISAPEILYPPTPRQPVTRAEVQQVTSGHERVWLILHIDVIDPQASATIQSTLGGLPGGGQARVPRRGFWLPSHCIAAHSRDIKMVPEFAHKE